MLHHFIICETGEKKFIKRIYESNEEAQQYLDGLLKEIRDKPGNYRMLSRSDSELILEELGEDGKGTDKQRKYQILKGEMEEVLALMQDPKDESKGSLL